MYLETTHGYYDKIISPFNLNDSILPMNINTTFWGDTFGTRNSLKEPYNNIKAGALLIKGIEISLDPNTSIAKIASLYNNLKATKVSDYGARVAKIYEEKPWEKN